MSIKPFKVILNNVMPVIVILKKEKVKAMSLIEF